MSEILIFERCHEITHISVYEAARNLEQQAELLPGKTPLQLVDHKIQDCMARDPGKVRFWRDVQNLITAHMLLCWPDDVNDRHLPRITSIGERRYHN